MTLQRHLSACFSAARPLVGAVAAIAVFALAVLSVSPAAHDWVHAHDHDHDQAHADGHSAPDGREHGNDHHRCAVTIAQQGFCNTTPLLVVRVHPLRMIEHTIAAAIEIRGNEPAYRLPHAQAPPRRARV